MLKFAGIPLNTTIRAYDFQPMQGRKDMYIEGVITGIDTDQFDGYMVQVTKDSDGDRTIVKVPMEVSFLEYDERITILKEA